MKMLIISEEFSNIRKKYDASLANKSVSFLLVGRSGSGKSYSLSTLPRPVLIDSFDPGSAKTLAPFVSNDFLVDTSYEEDMPDKPTAFQAWNKNMERRHAGGLFSQLGAYAIDSGTMFQEAMLSDILRIDGKQGKQPEIQHYGTHQRIMNQVLARLCTLPCHFVMTGHLDVFMDESDGRIHSTLMAYGKNKVKMPLRFSEIYLMEAKESSTGIARSFLTQGTGKLEARTKVGSGKLAVREAADFRDILRKCGYPYEDKESEI